MESGKVSFTSERMDLARTLADAMATFEIQAREQGKTFTADVPACRTPTSTAIRCASRRS